MTDCSVCTNPFSKSTRKAITCEFCPYIACMTCVKTYLLQTVHQPHCMNCRKEWTLDMLNARLPASFMKDEYRKMRETVFFEEEKTHLPALQVEAERLKTIERLNIDMMKIERKKQENNEKEDQLVSTQRAIHRELTKQTDELYAKQVDLRNNRRPREKREFIMKCPLNECRGFLSTAYKCGLCETMICKDCHKSKEEVHECNPDDVATITELMRTTKPCPKCHCRIYKTDGCDQMFCIQCHTPFSWRTGKIENGVIHNPHYFEALRAGNIQHHRHQAHQGGCGPMRDARTIRIFIREFCKAEKFPEQEISDEVFYFYQKIVHHRAVTLPMFTRVDDRDEERIKFMIGKIDEKKFKQRLYVYHKTSLRKIEEQQIMNTYVNTGEEIFRAITEKNIPEIICQLRTLHEITLAAVSDINKKYQHAGILKPQDIV